jgi:hypothetical protein
MLTKEQRKELNTRFWSGFKQFMRSEKSASGRRISWVSYPSDVKYIFIRMEADQHNTRLCIDIQSKDEAIRAIIWEQMTELKKVLENEMDWDTVWQETYTNTEGMQLSRIKWEKEGLNFYNEENWPEIMAFLKSRLVEFDRFYQEYKDILIALAE